MIKISDRIRQEVSKKPRSTVVSQNKRWFSEHYLQSSGERLPEKKDDILLYPGKIYCWSYDPLTPEDKLLHPVRCPAVSFMPLSLVIGHKITKDNNLVPYGIQLTYVPPQIRVRILDRFIEIFSADIIDPTIRAIKENKPITKSNLPVDWALTKSLLGGSGFEYCIRGYRYEGFLTPPQIVTFTDWWRICTFPLEFILTFNRLGIRSVYQKYYENLGLAAVRSRQKEIAKIEKQMLQFSTYDSLGK